MPMPICSRRNIIFGAAAMAIGTTLPLSRIAAQHQTNPLKIPKLLEGGADARRIYDLDIAAGISTFLPNLSTPTLGINGAYLGPTIRARAGDRVTLRVSFAHAGADRRTGLARTRWTLSDRG